MTYIRRHFRLVATCATLAAAGTLLAGAPAQAQEPVNFDMVAVSSAGTVTAPDPTRPDPTPNGTVGTGRLADAGTEWKRASAKDIIQTGQNSGTRSVIGDDNRTRITSMTGKYAKGVFFQVTNANYQVVTNCTGFMVSSEYMLTAGHCVHQGSGGTSGFYPNMDLFPAYNNKLAAGGMRCFKVQSWTSSAYMNNGSTTGDWGIVKLNCAAGRTYGTFGLNDSSLASGTGLEIFGYPVDKGLGVPYTGRGQVTNVVGDLMRHTVDTTGGQSGSPMLITDTAVAGIHTSGTTTFYPGQNHGTKITPALKSTINGIIF